MWFGYYHFAGSRTAFDERLQHLDELIKFLVTCKLASAQMRYANLSCVQVILGNLDAPRLERLSHVRKRKGYR